MNTYAIRSTLIGSLGVVLALASGSALAISFRITSLGPLSGTSVFGTPLNESGQVTGEFITTSGETRAFLWDGTRRRNLGTLGGRSSTGGSINASGQVTGRADTASGIFRAFL